MNKRFVTFSALVASGLTRLTHPSGGIFSLKYLNRLILVISFAVGQAAFAQAPPNTMAICGNPWYCVYDVPTYGSAETARAAFIAALGTNQYGQETFSNYTPGSFTNLGPFGGSQVDSLYVCNANGYCGGSGENNTLSQLAIPDSSDLTNYLYESDAYVGVGLYYIGFDYFGAACGPVNPSCEMFEVGVAGGPVTPTVFTEPIRGFFGVIASGALSNVQAAANIYFDRVLWVGGPGIGPNNPLWPDNAGSGGGCGQGKVCWFWYAVIGVAESGWLDPSGASAYTYSTIDGSNFTTLELPPGFSVPFDVSSGNTDFGLFESGQTVTFPSGGVSSFTVSGITPTVNGTNPVAFPVGVTLNSLVAQVEAIPSQNFAPPSQITVTTTGLTYGSGTGDATIALTNVSNGTLNGPFQILLTGLTNGVTLANAAGTYGPIYYLSPASPSSLSPGQSISLDAQFTNPSNSVITFAPVVFGGSGSGTAPITAVAVAPAPDLYGWNNSAVSITLAATDPDGPGVAQIQYSLAGAEVESLQTVVGSLATIGISAQGATALTYYATDDSGTVEAAQTSTIQIDENPPTISGLASPAANAYGWNNSSVTISFTCSDALSGVASCTAPVTLATQGAGQSALGSATDRAGNTASASVSNINIDETPPTIAFSGNAGTYTIDQTIAIACTATDSLSGIASSTCFPINGAAYSFNLGTNAFSATATDRAGNVGSASGSFTVKATLGSLENLVNRFVPNQGIANSLVTKLQNRQIGAFVNEVSSLESENVLTSGQAAILSRLAPAI